MTKLMQWLVVASILFAVWLSLVNNWTNYKVEEENRVWLYASPFILVAAFGLTSFLIIMYRVLTFNNCEKAAEELKQQLEEAKKDLTSKGFKFK